MRQATYFAFLVMMPCVMGMASAVTHVTVMRGERLTLKCEKKPGHMDWKNQDNIVLFFNDIQAFSEPRYSIHSFSDSDYTLVVSPVKFKDEGIYRCFYYNSSGAVSVRQFNVTVLGDPKIATSKHGDRTLVKCSAKGNTPPKISWVIGSDIDLEARPQHSIQDKTGKWITEDTLSIKLIGWKETLKCVLHHPSLPDILGVKFVTLVNKNFKPSTTQASSTAQSSTSPTFYSTDSPHVSTHFSVTGEAENTETTSLEISQSTNTNINTRGPEGPEGITSVLINTSSTLDNSTSVTENDTRDFTEEIYEKASPEKRQGGSASSLFICAVTALIICLLIVVTFLVVKLRRAHKKWKSEKEESDQSVESGKSKSSGEESKPKISIGFLKSNFRKYKVGEGALGKQTSASTTESTSTTASASTSVSASTSASASKPVSAAAPNTVVVTVENHTSNGVHHSQNYRAAASPVKETEL